MSIGECDAGRHGTAAGVSHFVHYYLLSHPVTMGIITLRLAVREEAKAIPYCFLEIIYIV